MIKYFNRLNMKLPFHYHRPHTQLHIIVGVKKGKTIFGIVAPMLSTLKKRKLFFTKTHYIIFSLFAYLLSIIIKPTNREHFLINSSIFFSQSKIV